MTGWSRAPLLALAIASFLPKAACAQSQPRIEVDMNVFSARNPFLTTFDNAVTVGGEILARAQAETSLAPGTRLETEASLGFRQYGREYGHFVTGNASLALDHRRNEYLSLRTLASFARVLPLEELTDNIDSAVDPISLQDRYELGQTVTWHRDARSTITGRMGWTKIQPQDSLLLNKTSAVDLSLAAERRIDHATTLGLEVRRTLGRSESGGDPRTWSLRFTAGRRFPGWRANIELGAIQVSRFNLAGGRSTGPVQLAGAASLCNNPSRLTVCITASVDSVVSSFAGIQRQGAVGASLSWRSSERGTFRVAGDYRRAPQTNRDGHLEVMHHSARYEHQLGSRFVLHGSTDYQRRTGLGGQTVDALIFQAGVTIRIPRP